MITVGYTIYHATREQRSATVGLTLPPMPSISMEELDELIAHLQRIRLEMDRLPDGGHHIL